MAEYVAGGWEAEAAAYDAGLIGSRRLMDLEMAMVDSDPADLFATAAAQPHDAGFVPLVRTAQAAGIPVEIVSDGFGFFIEPAMAALGVPELTDRDRPDDLRGAARRRSTTRTATRAVSSVGRASATGCWPIGRPAVGSCSSATARAIAMRPATATWSSPSARWSGSAWRPAGRSSAGRSSARSRPGWRRRSPPGEPIRRRCRGSRRRSRHRTASSAASRSGASGRIDPPPGAWPPPRPGPPPAP